MEALYLLIGCSVPVAIFFLAAFLLAVKNGQYDDTVTPAIRILFEAPPKQSKPESISPSNTTTPSSHTV